MTINTKYLRTDQGQLRETEKLVDRDELGDAAFRNAGEGAGDLLTPGAFGVGQSGLDLADNVRTISHNRLFRTDVTTENLPSGTGTLYWGLNVFRLSAARYILMGNASGLRYLTQTLSGWSEHTIWTTNNATVDSNGFLVESSPVVRLFSNQVEINNPNDDIRFVRNGVGDYIIKGTLGFAKAGWYIKTPKDANGNVKVFAEYEDIDGDIHVKTYEPDYSTGPCIAGAPVDIPDGRWIDIRLHEEPVEEDEDGESYVEELESMGD